MRQLHAFKAALVSACAEGQRRKQMRLQELVAGDRDTGEDTIALITSAVLGAARTGESEVSIVLGSPERNLLASEFLRAAGLSYMFSSRTSADSQRYPDKSGFALRVKIPEGLA